MANYHISPKTGKPEVCHAASGQCLYGDFDSPQQAYQHEESKARSQASPQELTKMHNSDKDMYATSPQWMGKTLDKVLTDRMTDNRFMASFDDPDNIKEAVQRAASPYKGTWDDIDASTDDECRDLEDISALAAAVSKNPELTSELAQATTGDNREYLTEKLQGIRDNADEDTASKAERVLDTLW